MADRGRVGSLVVASRRCAKQCWRSEHEAHMTRMTRVESATDHTIPATATVAPTRYNLKKERILEDRYGEIDRDNRILLKKIKENISKKAPLFEDGPKNVPSSLNIGTRKKEMLEITKENQRLLKAMKGVKPVYSAKGWAKNDQRNADLLRNCSAFPVITRKSRNQSAPSVLMPVAEVADYDPMRMSSQSFTN
eukprot:TRINITY_DN76050_c0_g1_i1.p1 TRINITY_DN76050_c0_g1~~TRINITY_DN76050_c0_g1_i1.p1  ORF type:complete len:193 (-),score=22.43 TRINITY_DN76050_c0_g1_i1:76-654(-)